MRGTAFLRSNSTVEVPSEPQIRKVAETSTRTPTLPRKTCQKVERLLNIHIIPLYPLVGLWRYVLARCVHFAFQANVTDTEAQSQLTNFCLLHIIIN